MFYKLVNDLGDAFIGMTIPTRGCSRRRLVFLNENSRPNYLLADVLVEGMKSNFIVCDDLIEKELKVERMCPLCRSSTYCLLLIHALTQIAEKDAHF